MSQRAQSVFSLKATYRALTNSPIQTEEFWKWLYKDVAGNVRLEKVIDTSMLRRTKQELRAKGDWP